MYKIIRCKFNVFCFLNKLIPKVFLVLFFILLKSKIFGFQNIPILFIVEIMFSLYCKTFTFFNEISYE